MIDDQIQALEALYKASDGRYSTLVDLRRVTLPISAGTLDDLVKQGFTRTVGHGHFSITRLGIDKALENRHVPPADE